MLFKRAIWQIWVCVSAPTAHTPADEGLGWSGLANTERFIRRQQQVNTTKIVQRALCVCAGAGPHGGRLALKLLV